MQIHTFLMHVAVVYHFYFVFANKCHVLDVRDEGKSVAGETGEAMLGVQCQITGEDSFEF